MQTKPLRGTVLLAVLIVFGALFPMSTAGAETKVFQAWAKNAGPAITAIVNTYDSIVADLNKNDDSAAEAGFFTYSHDAVTLASFANSPSKKLNLAIVELATAANYLAWDGYLYLSTGHSTYLGAYKSAKTAVIAGEDAVAAQLRANE
jgi:hypothetical protein